MKIAAIAALALAPALALIFSVQAQAREAGPAVHVSYADLNLRTDAGLRALDRRLAQAVRAVCSDRNAEVQLARQRNVRRCVDETKAELAVARERALAEQPAPALLAGRGR